MKHNQRAVFLAFLSLLPATAPAANDQPDAKGKPEASCPPNYAAFGGGRGGLAVLPKDPESLEFKIPAAQIEAGRKAVDQKFLKETMFILPNNDGEAKRSVDILKALRAPNMQISAQAWGAVLEGEVIPSVQRLQQKGVKRLVVFEMPGEKIEKAYRDAGIDVVVIDHHDYQGLGLNRHQKESSLEQLMKLLKWPASRTDQALAANDRSYIPGLKAMGLTPDEIDAVRRYDLLAQGKWSAYDVVNQVEKSRALIPQLKKRGDVFLIDHVPVDQGILKQELAIASPDGRVTSFSAERNKSISFSGDPAMAKALLDFPFEKYGYKKGEFDQYGGGDATTGMFFGFKPHKPPKGSKELIPQKLVDDLWAAMDKARANAKGSKPGMMDQPIQQQQAQALPDYRSAFFQGIKPAKPGEAVDLNNLNSTGGRVRARVTDPLTGQPKEVEGYLYVGMVGDGSGTIGKLGKTVKATVTDDAGKVYFVDPTDAKVTAAEGPNWGPWQREFLQARMPHPRDRYVVEVKDGGGWKTVEGRLQLEVGSDARNYGRLLSAKVIDDAGVAHNIDKPAFYPVNRVVAKPKALEMRQPQQQQQAFWGGGGSGKDDRGGWGSPFSGMMGRERILPLDTPYANGAHVRATVKDPANGQEKEVTGWLYVGAVSDGRPDVRGYAPRMGKVVSATVTDKDGVVHQLPIHAKVVEEPVREMPPWRPGTIHSPRDSGQRVRVEVRDGAGFKTVEGKLEVETISGQYGFKVSNAAVVDDAGVKHTIDNPDMHPIAWMAPKPKPVFKTVDFAIKPEHVAKAKQQLDRKFMDETLFILPNNDGEAKRAVDILRAAEAPHVKVSHQAWGAVLDKEGGIPSPAELKSQGIKRLSVFEIPGEAVEKQYRDAGIEVAVIDHHAYAGLDRRHPESSLEQLAKQINWPLSKIDEALAVNDRGYIPGLKAMGLSPDEISDIRKFDLMAQGKSAGQVDAWVDEARREIPKLKFRDGVYLLDDVRVNEGILKQELAIQSPDGMLSSYSNGMSASFSGDPAMAQALLAFPFEKYGYPKGSFAQYGGGDPNASMFFGFKPKEPPAGARELIPQNVKDAMWEAMMKARKDAGREPAADVRKEIAPRFIGATTPAEYKAAMDDPALSRRLPAVELKGPPPVGNASSAIGVKVLDEVKAAGMMPRGSAVITSSGNLEKEGIRHIIHAASGAMTRKEGVFAPSLDGVTNSVANSLALAAANGHKRVAVPFIGGKIFLPFLKMEAQDLANEIVDAAIKNRKGLELRFVTFGDEDTQLFQKALARHKDLPRGAAEVKNGSITDGKLHGATAIVNAANMEVEFGGGLSGAIARATGQADRINAEAKAAIKKFYDGASPSERKPSVPAAGKVMEQPVQQQQGRAGGSWFSRGKPSVEAKAPELPLNPAKGEINYKVLGEGNKDTIVLIHGLDSNLGTFDVNVNDLAKKYKVVVYDQRGHGQSKLAGKDYSSHTMANDLKALLDHLGIEKATILGHSMGGRTAARFAEKFPERTASLIVEDMEMIARRAPDSAQMAKYMAQADEMDKAFADRNFKSREDLSAALKPFFGNDTDYYIGKRAVKNPDGSYTLQFNPGASIRYGYQTNTEDLTEAVKSYGGPTLFLKSDPAVGSAISRKGDNAIKCIGNACSRVIPDADHTIHKSHPREFLASVTQFVDNTVLPSQRQPQMMQQPVQQQQARALGGNRFRKDDLPTPKELDAQPSPSVGARLGPGSQFDPLNQPGMMRSMPKTNPPLDNAYSALGLQIEPEVRKARMMPRGSALVTSSGDLEKQGIKHIIHAASGAMGAGGKHFDPTAESVMNSVVNSMALAQKHGHKRVAVPFIGGKIFLDRIGIDAQSLADQIVDAAVGYRKGVEVRFVAFSPEDAAIFRKALARHSDLPTGAADVLQGDITNASLHGATAIVNAANMEVQFGGGLSGAIGRATGQARAIDDEAEAAIERFYQSTTEARTSVPASGQMMEQPVQQQQARARAPSGAPNGSVRPPLSKTTWTAGTKIEPEVTKAGMMPRGSALVTSAGSLEKQGIRNVIHAAPGAMTRDGDLFDPTMESVANSVINSLTLARANAHRRVAVPFIGGGIFIDRITNNPQKLVDKIVDTAVANLGGLQVRFVPFSDADTAMFRKALARHKDLPKDAVEITQGDITKFSTHGATAIVNAANMEVTFGGGISGVIGRATGQEDKINQEAQAAIKDYYSRVNR